MKPTNLLFLMSDQHTRDVAGCYGHPIVETPNIDRLAERGTRFTSAYTTCPICVPARASLATGRYVHQIGNWDNACPYDGSVTSWGHRLRDQGNRVDSIGKLHFRRQEDDVGFTEAIDPLNVVDGVGDIPGCIRKDPPSRKKRPGIERAGPGTSTYQDYDASITDRACRWLSEHRGDEAPWVLFVSFVCPHPPYIAPESLFRLYSPDDLPLPPQWRGEEWPNHPAIDHFRRFFDFAEPFPEPVLRRLAAAYFGVCTYLDGQIGQILHALDAIGLTDTTRIAYTSDHGEHLGARGIFGKFTMYEESSAVPLILSGPDVPQGATVGTPASLVDLYPTVLETVGATPSGEDADLPGRSLFDIIGDPDGDRTVFSEYHAVGSQNAIYMLRDRRYKYVYYVDGPPQLFDLQTDPLELSDLSTSSGHKDVLEDFGNRLRALLDPEAVDAQAKAAQKARVDTFGGEEAVRARGAFDNSPVPGETPAFRKYD